MVENKPVLNILMVLIYSILLEFHTVPRGFKCSNLYVFIKFNKRNKVSEISGRCLY